jgi:hypothetical protein
MSKKGRTFGKNGKAEQEDSEFIIVVNKSTQSAQIQEALK